MGTDRGEAWCSMMMGESLLRASWISEAIEAFFICMERNRTGNGGQATVQSRRYIL